MTTDTNSAIFLNDLNSIAASYIANQNNTNIANILYFMTFQSKSDGNAIEASGINQGLNPNNFNTATTTDLKSYVDSYYHNVLGNSGSVPSYAYDPTNAGSPLFAYYTIYQRLVDSNQSPVPVSNLPAQFNALFTDFIKNMSFSILSNDSNTSTVKIDGITYTTGVNNNWGNFNTAFFNYLSTTAVISTSSTSSVLSWLTNQNSSGATYIQSYQTIYESFNGSIGTLSQNSANWTVAQRVFVQRLSAFYTSELAKTATAADPAGFFIPSQDLGDWYTYSQNLYYNPQYSPNALTRDARSTIILDEVLRALISMIGTIQTVAAAQANSLNFLSKWQEAYTNKLNQIRTFAQGDGTALGTFSDAPPYYNGNWDQNGAQAVRNALNNINQSYITKMQANQQTISDNAKSLQTNVNQSNDAANQQGSMADSILQELSSILSSIFR